MKLNSIPFFYAIVLMMAMGCHTSQKAPAAQKATTVQDPQLLNGRWVLEELNGYPMDIDSFDRDKPYIEIQTATKMYFGYSGCNRINGQVEYTDRSIHFKPGPMTRMACIEGNIETDFMKALFSCKHYSFNTEKLELKNEYLKVVCRFRKSQ